MASTQSTNDQIRRSRGLRFDGAVCGFGLALFLVAGLMVAIDGLGPATPALLGIPLILIVSRLPDDVCNLPYADGLDEQRTGAFLDGSEGLISSQQDQVPKVPSEPKVR